VIQRGEKITGLVTVHDLKDIPRDKWPEVTVSQVMTGIAQLKRTSPETELMEAMEEMDRDGVNQLPVMQDGELVGMLSREDVISYLRTLHELER
jgi:CBS domain-containing protein